MDARPSSLGCRHHCCLSRWPSGTVWKRQQAPSSCIPLTVYITRATRNKYILSGCKLSRLTSCLRGPPDSSCMSDTLLAVKLDSVRFQFRVFHELNLFLFLFCVADISFVSIHSIPFNVQSEHEASTRRIVQRRPSVIHSYLLVVVGRSACIPRLMLCIYDV